MSRTLSPALIILFIAMMTAACGNPGPDDALGKFMDAMLKGRYEESYSYVSAPDRAVKDLQSYLSENQQRDEVVIRAIAKYSSYKTLSMEESETQASAEVEITQPDFRGMLAEIKEPRPARTRF